MEQQAEPSSCKRLLITPGEPAGIGPDLAILLTRQAHHSDNIVIADPELLQARAEQLEQPIRLKVLNEHAIQQLTPSPTPAGELRCLPINADVPVSAGKPDPANAAYVLHCLDSALALCSNGHAHAMVTGPVNKGVINDAGIAFSGHTEYLAEHSGAALPLMLLATPGLRVALVTTHLPLREVADAITTERLEQILRILHQGLQQRFGIAEPRIVVAGLNPHAGEDGHLGREEIDIISPVLNDLRRQGMQLTGPLPADTLFTPKYLDSADAVLAMYHDQGLPVLKHKGFGQAANITLGLPIIRTSVDHGTALELAGTGNIDIGSLRYAMQAALSLKAGRHD